MNIRLLWFVEKFKYDKVKTSVMYEKSLNKIWQNKSAQLVKVLAVSNLGTKHHLVRRNGPTEKRLKDRANTRRVAGV